LFWIGFVHPFFSSIFIFHPFYPSSSKNAHKHKRFKRLNSNKNMLKWYNECAISYCFLMGTYLLETNRWCFGWHIIFNYEEVVFELTHNSWLWTSFFHPFFIHFIFFIYHNFSSIFIFHPFFFHFLTHGKYSSMSWNIFYYVSTKYSYKNSIMFTYSCSLDHAHIHTFTK
jgi:hypothetical protein